jgi:hypothetical protein
MPPATTSKTHAAGESSRDLLGDQRHLEPRLAGEFAAVDAQLAGEELEQRRFAAAVAAEQAEAVPRLELQIDAVEQRRAAEGEGDVAQRDQGHATSSGENGGRVAHHIPPFAAGRQPGCGPATTKIWGFPVSGKSAMMCPAAPAAGRAREAG